MKCTICGHKPTGIDGDRRLYTLTYWTLNGDREVAPVLEDACRVCFLQANLAMAAAVKTQRQLKGEHRDQADQYRGQRGKGQAVPTR